MRSIRYFGNGDVHLAEVPEVQITAPDEVKIRIAYCGVCGSDLHTKRAELDQLYGDSVKTGMSVAISGGGAMGLIITQLALRSGATKLTVFEPIASKREMALKLGARYAVDPLAEDRVAAGMKITNGIGYDVVIEASGNWRACDGIQKLVARGGLLEFFAALYKHDYDYPMNLLDAFFQEITVIGGVMQSPYMFPRSVALADELDLDALLVDGCVFTPEQVADAFEAQMNGKTIKSLICFDPDAK